MLVDLRRYVRELIREEIGRDYKSVQTMPMNFEHYPELIVVIDFLSDGKWVAHIKPEKQYRGYTADEEIKYFNSKVDADNWARQVADRMRREIMQADSEFPSFNMSRLPKNDR